MRLSRNRFRSIPLEMEKPLVNKKRYSVTNEVQYPVALRVFRGPLCIPRYATDNT